MKLARIILAPLLALALLLTQIAPLADTITTVANCGCHRAVCCCCQMPAKSDSAPRPAAPARTFTQNDWQVVSAVVEQNFHGVDCLRPSPFHIWLPLEAATIPLYQWDCVLLI
jgi:hypothetical protein